MNSNRAAGTLYMLYTYIRNAYGGTMLLSGTRSVRYGPVSLVAPEVPAGSMWSRRCHLTIVLATSPAVSWTPSESREMVQHQCCGYRSSKQENRPGGAIVIAHDLVRATHCALIPTVFLFCRSCSSLLSEYRPLELLKQCSPRALPAMPF
jgi:hypothetical protein